MMIVKISSWSPPVTQHPSVKGGRVIEVGSTEPTQVVDFRFRNDPVRCLLQKCCEGNLLLFVSDSSC